MEGPADRPRCEVTCDQHGEGIPQVRRVRDQAHEDDSRMGPDPGHSRARVEKGGDQGGAEGDQRGPVRSDLPAVPAGVDKRGQATGGTRRDSATLAIRVVADPVSAAAIWWR